MAGMMLKTMILKESETVTRRPLIAQGVVWAALAAGVALRLLFIWRYSNVSVDTLLYGDFAQNLLRHGIYGFSANVNGLPIVRPTLIRLPGYPLFLLVCFAIFGTGKYVAVMLVQAVLDLWTCLLFAGSARRLFNERAAHVALWLGTLCPFMANYVASPLTEIPTLFCIALATYALIRWQEKGCSLNRWCGVLAFALAWAILLRPEQGLLAAALVPAMLWISFHAPGQPWKRLKPALAVSILTLLPLVPWTARNWHTFHVFQPLAPKFANDPGEFNPYGFQRWYRTWAIDFSSTDQIYWPFNGDSIAIADLPNRAFDSNEQYAATEALFADYDQTTSVTPALDARFAAIAQERVAADPIRYYVELPIARVVNMIFRPRVDFLPVPNEWWKFHKHRRATLFASAYGLLNLAYLVLAAACIATRSLWIHRAPIILGMLATLVLRSLLLLTIDNSEPRYTLEFYPVLIILAAAFIASWNQHRPRRSFVIP